MTGWEGSLEVVKKGGESISIRDAVKEELASGVSTEGGRMA